MPYTYRHVLGWYRIVKEFDEAGVRAICVFDGSERSEAKKAEVRVVLFTRRCSMLIDRG
jgi:flap endonuclease-1